MPKSKETLEKRYEELIKQMKGKESLDLVEFLHLRNFKSQIWVETDEEKIKEQTKLALSKARIGGDENIKEALKILCTLEGISTPSASAILHFIFPGEYAIMDIYCWERAKKYEASLSKTYGEGKKARENYIIYLKILDGITKETGKTLREIEREWFYEGRQKKVNL